MASAAASSGATTSIGPPSPPNASLQVCDPPSPMQMGIELFNRDLTKDERKKIGTTLTNNNQNQPCNLDDLLKDTAKLQENRKRQRSDAHERIDRVIRAISQHAQVIDVLIQQQPNITAIIWGGVRFLIGVAAKEIDTSEKISQALVEILGSLGRWNKYLELFDEFERVRETAAHLFSQIVNFLVRTKIYYSRPRFVRHFWVAFSTYAQKFDSIMSLIQNHGRALEQEATLASEIRLAEDRKAHKAQFDITQKEFAKQTQLQNALSDNLHQITLTFEEEHLRRESITALKWLQQCQQSFFHSEGEKGTGTWVEESSSWMVWEASLWSKPLCICGPPGSGKSTIASRLFTNTRTSVAITYFFRSLTDKDQATPGGLAASLLYDMLRQKSVQSNPRYALFVSQILALSGPKKRVVDVKFRQLWDIVTQVTPCLPAFTLIIDGLDECDGSDDISPTQMISEFIALSTTANARLVVLFRHHPYLETAFRDCPTIEITPATISSDIQLYVSAEIQRHPKKLQHLEKEILKAILGSCRGLFLWAEMMLKCLKSANTCSEQLTYLKKPPPDLYTFYDNITSSTTAQLAPDSLILRREILLFLVGIYTALPCQELSYVLSLVVGVLPRAEELNALIESEETVLRLCWPLVRVSKHQVHLMHETVKDYLTRPGPDTSSHLHITSDESESYLASKCLAALSREEYRSINKIAILIRRNVASAAEEEDDKYFYQYAATHWYVHLTAVQKPKMELVQQAAKFLVGNEFVSWSEFIFQLSGSQGMMLEVESKLNIWRKGLSEELQGVLILDRYFSGPYRAAADVFEDDGGDKTLSYLCLFQLGEYYNLAARIEEAFEVKRTVARGLIDLLGERHPLSLMAQSAFALEYLGQRRFPEAEETFRRLAQIQREVLGTDRPDCFQSLQRQGMAELWMTKFSDADMSITESLSGFINTVGVTNFLYLLSQLTMGQILEYQGELRRAFLDYEHIWRYRSSILGPDNPMAVWARCAMVSAYRKLGLYEEADKAILEVIDTRTRTIGPKQSPTVDAIIHKVVLYLDMERDEEALELIDFILDGDLVDEWFEREVQVNHVRALLELFAGKVELAIEILQSIVDQSNQKEVEGRVRSLLWVLLDFAIILRENGRGDEAPILFDELVTSIDSDSSSSWKETQSPSELALAEKALILVREMKPYDADVLLKENGLKWLRPKEFWILNGSPPADTASMKRPYVTRDPKWQRISERNVSFKR